MLVLAPGVAVERSSLIGKLPAEALAALREGTGEDALVEAVRRRAGDAMIPRVHVALDRLARAGALRFAVRAGRRELAVLEPSSPDFTLRPLGPPPDRRLQLSRFACLRRHGDVMVLESPRAHARLVLGDPAIAGVLAGLAAPCTPRELGPSLGALVSLLARADFLVEVDASGRSAEERDPALAGWEFHDLLFHVRSRRGRHREPSGATYRLAGITEPPPVVAPLRGPALELARCDLGLRARTDPPLAAVMEARRSIREAGAQPIQLAQLAELLERCAGVRALLPGERDGISRRPYPSGGARYPLELYVAARSCEGLAPGLYRYDPLGHRLETVRGLTGEVAALIEAARVGTEPPQVLLVLAARFLRVSWKYASIAYALVLEEAGVLLQSIYLTATAIGVGACGVGSGDIEVFARAAGVEPEVEGSVAAIVLGSLPPC